MSKTKLLTIAVITLLLLNISAIGFMVYNGPMRNGPRHRGEGPKRLIIEKLHFDDQQQAQYKALIQTHHEMIQTLDEQILETKNRLYLQLLKTTVDAKAEDSIINVIVGYQKQIEETHFKHFQDIKKICKPDQMENYYDLTEELSRLFSKHPKDKHE